MSETKRAIRESAKPLYQAVLEELKLDIKNGIYAANRKLPSEAQLMRKYGVSRITVGRALRELQHENLIERVAGSGSYVRDNAALRLENLTFGLIIPNLGDTEIFEPICQGIAGVPEAKGHALLWSHSGSPSANREQQTLELCRQCIARRVSGVFFAPLELTAKSVQVNRAVLKWLRRAKIPVVLLDRQSEAAVPTRDKCDLVGIDNIRAGFVATRHLLQLGARRVGFIGYENQAATVKSRILGYREALSGNENGSISAQKNDEAEERIFLFKSGSRLKLPVAALDCDGFVCANDRIAGHLMHALLSKGIRIPEDVRLVGIDDVKYADLLSVPLTTIHQPCREIGETAMRVMLERLAHPQMPFRDVLLNCEITVRKSCGAEPVKDDRKK